MGSDSQNPNQEPTHVSNIDPIISRAFEDL